MFGVFAGFLWFLYTVFRVIRVSHLTNDEWFTWVRQEIYLLIVTYTFFAMMTVIEFWVIGCWLIW